MITYADLQRLVRNRMQEKSQMREKATALLKAVVETCCAGHGFNDMAFGSQTALEPRNYETAAPGAPHITKLSQNDEGRWTCHLFVTVGAAPSGFMVIYISPEIGFRDRTVELGFKDRPERIVGDFEDPSEAVSKYVSALLAQVENGIKLFGGRVHDPRSNEVGFHTIE